MRFFFRNYDINYKMVLIPPDSQEYKRFEETYPEFSDTIPDFPRIILCNRQRHSRHKILDKYPNLTMHDLISLYQDIPTYKEMAYKQHNPETLGKTLKAFYKGSEALNNMNLTKFEIDTDSDCMIMRCQIWNIDCTESWRQILTPAGVCHILTYKKLYEKLRLVFKLMRANSAN